MDASTRDLVWDRAGFRCEYCRIHQEDEPFYRLHVEHIVAKQHGGIERSRPTATPAATSASPTSSAGW